ncbi:amino acid ABC transporter permease [Streptomyces sp. NPDC020096]
MNVLLDNFALFRHGFIGTVVLTAVSAVLSLALGTLVAAFRVSPVPPLRIFGTVWVTLLRNTPLTLLFMIAVFVAPQILFPGISYFTLAVSALGCYTSAFVCEALRSGVNSVPLGQAEAARSLGMTFSQTLRLIVLPQATRTVIPPIGSLMIALTKNSAIAGSFNVAELFAQQKRLSEIGYNILEIFVWIALAYLVVTFAISALFRLLEHRLAVAR